MPRHSAENGPSGTPAIVRVPYTFKLDWQPGATGVSGIITDIRNIGRRLPPQLVRVLPVRGQGVFVTFLLPRGQNVLYDGEINVQWK